MPHRKSTHYQNQEHFQSRDSGYPRFVEDVKILPSYANFLSIHASDRTDKISI